MRPGRPHHRGDGAAGWQQVIDELRSFASRAGDDIELDTIKSFDRRRGADHDQLERVLAALDAGRPVALLRLVADARWPRRRRRSSASTPWRCRRRTASGPDCVDGHAVVIVGYGRHDAFPGGGYVIVRNGWRDRVG